MHPSPPRTALPNPCNPGFLDAHSPELAALVLDTVPSYTVANERRAVGIAVQLALSRSDAFLKAFTAALLKAAAGAGRSPSYATALPLVELSSLVLARLDPEANKKAAAKVVEAQAALLDVVAAAAAATASTSAGSVGGGAEARHWGPASRAVGRALRAQPGLLAEYTAAAAGGAGGPGLARALLDHCDDGASSGAAEVRSQLLGAVCERLLGAKERPGAQLLSSYAPLLAGLSADEFGAKALPALSRALRRTPEPALASLIVLLGAAASLDAGAAAGELLSLLLQQLRTKEALRPLALDALAALAARLPGAEVQAAAVRGVTSLLDGSAEGKVKAAGERVALWGALAALATAPAGPRGSGAHADVAADAAAAAAALYKEEPVEEVRLALLGALGAWLPRLRCGGAELPAAVAAQLAAGLGEVKEPLRRGHLRALGAALWPAAQQGRPAATGEDALAAQLGCCMAPLLKLVADGCAKATLRADGVAALAAAAAIGGASAGAAQQLHGAACWAGAVGADSPLLAPATLGKLSGGEAAPAGPLAAALLTAHAAALPAGGDVAAARALVLCLLHHAPEPRGAAVVAAGGALLAALALLVPLLDALLYWEDNAAAAAVLAVSAAHSLPATGRA